MKNHTEFLTELSQQHGVVQFSAGSPGMRPYRAHLRGFSAGVLRYGGNMRILAFITEGVQISRILEHIGVHTQAPRIAPARGPPLWDACDAQGADAADLGKGARIEPDWGESAQTAPNDAFDQRTDW